MWINYQYMELCPLILNFLHKSSQKWLVFANYFGLPNFYPNWPIFLHGYIRHIRDIFQLCCLVSGVELHFRSSWQFAMHPSPSSIKTLNAEMLLLRINIIANGTLSFCISFYFHLHFLLGESFTFTHTTHQEPG